MAKVGILTFHRGYNFGALFQAYALQETVRKLGHEPEIIDYRWDEPHGRALMTRIRRSLIDTTADILYSRKNLGGGFENFWSSRYSLSPSFTQWHEGADVLKRYDFIIVGSDQVWNPNFIRADPGFLLENVPANVKILSYAASFGISDFSREKYPEYSARFDAMLRRMSFVSVREQHGVGIIERNFGAQAECVLDPTLLCDEEFWASISRMPEGISDPYIFMYPLRRINNVATVAHLLKKELKMPLLSVVAGGGGATGVPSIQAYFDKQIDFKVVCDPSTFLGLHLNARAVVTNSFHGTALTINFQKPLWVVYDGYMTGKASVGSRMDSITEIFGLTSRRVKLPCSEKLPPLDMSYEVAGKRLLELRERSMKLLKDALS